MMTQAFYTGISGIRSDQYAIDVVSDNIANLSTVGFRGAEYEFASMFEESLNTTSGATTSSIGVGSRLQATTTKMGEGVLQLSDRSTDLALLGEGWFGVQGTGNPVYTRDGAFTFDANNDLVSLDGFHVLGTMAGNIAGEVLTSDIAETILGDVAAQENLNFPTSLTYPGEATTQATLIGNLAFTEDQIKQDNAALADIAANALDPDHEITLQRAALTISATVINSEGVKNNLRLEFTKVDPQVLPGSQWNISATTETLDGETIFSTENGTVSFNENGGQISNTLTSIDNEGTTVNIDLGTDYSGIVSFGGSFTSSSSSNGTISGDLLGYEINKNAEVIATFSNGVQSSVGKVAVFHFQNDKGLHRLNGSKFEESSNSGSPIFYKDAAGNNIIGTGVINHKLEGSNIDMTYGLTELIVLQRSYSC